MGSAEAPGEGQLAIGRREGMSLPSFAAGLVYPRALDAQ